MNIAVLNALQGVVNRALRLDPQVASILGPLAGKRIAVQVTGAVPLRVLVEIAHENVYLTHEIEPVDEAPESPRPSLDDAGTRSQGQADVSITGSVSALAMLVRGVDDLPSTARVRVHGDVALLQQARVAVARLQPDFEEPIARVLGDEIAYPLVRVVRRVVSGAQRTVRELGDDARDFLGEESGLLADRDAVNEFSDEVDRLRDALERLEKRVSRVSGRLVPRQ